MTPIPPEVLAALPALFTLPDDLKPGAAATIELLYPTGKPDTDTKGIEDEKAD